MGMRSITGMVAATLVITASCVTESPGPPSVTWQRPECPFTRDVVMFGGDSLVTQWPRWVSLPGLVPFTTARGGSAYTGNLTTDPDFGTIGSRLLDELDACGNDIGAVVLSGGHVDLSYGRTADQVIAAIDELDDQLYARGVATVFLAITPVPNATDWYPAHQAARRTVNAWMETPGNLHARVVDCAALLEAPAGSDILASRFWNYIDALGTIDLVHPNDAAYATIGSCIAPTVVEAVDDGVDD